METGNFLSMEKFYSWKLEIIVFGDKLMNFRRNRGLVSLEVPSSFSGSIGNDLSFAQCARFQCGWNSKWFFISYKQKLLDYDALVSPNLSSDVKEIVCLPKQFFWKSQQRTKSCWFLLCEERSSLAQPIWMPRRTVKSCLARSLKKSFCLFLSLFFLTEMIEWPFINDAVAEEAASAVLRLFE